MFAGVWTRRTRTARRANALRANALRANALRANALRVFVTSYSMCSRKKKLTQRQEARPHGAHLELESSLDCES